MSKATITGQAAREARKALKASQADAAAAVGINRAFYSEFEAGRYLLSDNQQQR
ncbi:MAG: helix-turn-helix domain-containing protein, partial [Steroidobacteraceae bacterium]